MEKAAFAFCKKEFVKNCFLDLNETFGKTPCNFLNEKEVDHYHHHGDATTEISPFNWESISSGLSKDEFALFVNAFDSALQIRDKLKLERLVLHNNVFKKIYHAHRIKGIIC